MAKLTASGDVIDGEVKHPRWPLFNLAFRPFFLFGALFSVLALVLWWGVVTGQWQPQLYGGGLWWHMHEMLFGFVVAIVVGFLLTAVQNWTKLPSVSGLSLFGLFVLWLLGRVLLVIPIAPTFLAFLVDVSFLPVAAACFGLLIIRAKLWRNMIFVPIFLLLFVANMLMHATVLWGKPNSYMLGAQITVLTITLLMCLIAGRVFPMFTANGTGTERVPSLVWLERLCIASVLVLLICHLGLFSCPPQVAGTLFIVAAMLHAVRVCRWRFWVTLKTPLVWSLHLAYWSIPCGLLLWGLYYCFGWFSLSQAIHCLTVGAMGLMILAMISRVSLGHTGRKIVAAPIMSLAFLALFFSFLVRVFGVGLLPSPMLLTIAVALWVTAFGLFVVRYYPILTKPRVDGRLG